MNLLEDLVTMLAATTAVANAVATNPKSDDKCIRAERLFQTDELPGIVLNIKRTLPLNDFQRSGLEVMADLSVSCVGRSSAAANDLAKLVNTRLEPFRGATANGFVESVEWDDMLSGFQPYEEGADDGEYITEILYKVFYRQT